MTDLEAFQQGIDIHGRDVEKDRLRAQVRNLKAEIERLRRDRDEWKMTADAVQKSLNIHKDIVRRLERGK